MNNFTDSSPSTTALPCHLLFTWKFKKRLRQDLSFWWCVVLHSKVQCPERRITLLAIWISFKVHLTGGSVVILWLVPKGSAHGWQSLNISSLPCPGDNLDYPQILSTLVLWALQLSQDQRIFKKNNHTLNRLLRGKSIIKRLFWGRGQGEVIISWIY